MSVHGAVPVIVLMNASASCRITPATVDRSTRIARFCPRSVSHLEAHVGRDKIPAITEESLPSSRFRPLLRTALLSWFSAPPAARQPPMTEQAVGPTAIER